MIEILWLQIYLPIAIPMAVVVVVGCVLITIFLPKILGVPPLIKFRKRHSRKKHRL